MPFRLMTRLMLGLVFVSTVSSVWAAEGTRKPGLGVSLVQSVHKVAPGEYTQVTLKVALNGLKAPIGVSLVPRGGLQLAGNLERTLDVSAAGDARLPLSLKAPGPGRYQLTLHFVAPEQGGLNRRTVVAVFDAGGADVQKASRPEPDAPYTTLEAQERIER